MSAILVLRQRTSVHLLTDAVVYDREGIVHSVNDSKCVAIPTMSAAFACTGAIQIAPFFAFHLTKTFASFDDLVERGEDLLPAMFKDCAENVLGSDASSTLYFIGWHEKDRRPAAYAMECWTDRSSRIGAVFANSRNGDQTRRFRLQEQLVAGTPLPDAATLTACGFRLPVDENTLDPARDLLHLMEIQRQEVIEGKHWIGGKALLTSIDVGGISQRVVHHWAEDCIGQPIQPPAMDWGTYRLNGLSRLQRERMERKSRKGT